VQRHVVRVVGRRERVVKGAPGEIGKDGGISRGGRANCHNSNRNPSTSLRASSGNPGNIPTVRGSKVHMGIWEDLRFAGRLLLKDKWFSLVAAVALALGIGVNATVFTFVNAVLIRGLPIADPDRTMAIDSFDRVRNQGRGVSYLDYRDWRENTRAFDAFGAYSGTIANLSDEGQPPERYNGSFLSANTFGVLGMRPVIGRDFVPDDDQPGAQSVALIGHAVWVNRYGKSPDVIGKTVRINDNPSTIIGVMSEGVRFPFNTDVWLPLSQMTGLLEQKRNARPLQTFGHLAPGVTRAQGQAELINISKKIEQENPETNKDIQARVQTFNEQQNGGPIRVVFLSLMGAVAFVLLIACANVANLTLSRMSAREREIAIRAALGASRWRVTRQLMTESLLLAAVGGLCGLLLATWGLDALVAFNPADIPRLSGVRINATALLFTFAASVVTGLIFGLVPAWQASRGNLNQTTGGRGSAGNVKSARLRSALVVAEVALSLVAWIRWSLFDSNRCQMSDVNRRVAEKFSH
jgi:putative ABC transport system permease protein